MDQKRFILFIVLSMAILVGWNAFIVPRFMPPRAKPAAQNAAEDKAADQADDQVPADGKGQVADKQPEIGPARPDGEAAEDAKPGDKNPLDAKVQVAADKPDEDKPAEKARPAARESPKFHDRTVELGSILFDKGKGYRQLVTLSSRGAAIEKIELNDPRYITLKVLNKPHAPLTVVGDDPKAPGTLE